MATAEAIEAQIAAARQLLTQREAEVQRLEDEIQAANERQRLRRVLDELNAEIAEHDETIVFSQNYRAEVDMDLNGYHTGVARRSRMDVSPHPYDSQQAAAPTSSMVSSRVSCSEAVESGELEWTIEGMSWLNSTLRQASASDLYMGHCAASKPVQVGNSVFRLAYSPKQRMLHTRHPQGEAWKSSLAVVHHTSSSLLFRHSFFIKRNDGEFIQWGQTCEECNLHVDTHFWRFGPDTVEHEPRTLAAGVFGLSHEKLLLSEWVVDDTLTVKVKLEVRSAANATHTSSSRESRPPITVPPPTLGTDLLAQLEAAEGASEGAAGDVTFVVGGERLRAHALILCARSEVFRHMLSGSMCEARSREVTVVDDATTFRALLRFIYTDDLQSVAAWIQQTAASASSDEASDEASNGDASNGDTSSNSTAVASTRTALLQRLLAVSHRYRLERLQVWCEGRLAEVLNLGSVCSCLCQAHLYGAIKLEEVCLDYISDHHAQVSVTPEFGALGAEWPAVMLKIVHKLTGVEAAAAAPALEAATVQGSKRKRDEQREPRVGGSS